ncbi:MAG: sigma-70 family RNA polymerase sigma factor [Solirubrobacteraceae bacterium]
MSPSTLRRYRAERLLRQEFGGLREEVLRSVRGRLRSRGVHLDDGDLEACYAAAWQGLYAAIDAGEEIANPGGWLAVVTFRRAIDEHRGARARGLGGLAQIESAGSEREVAGAAAEAHVAHTARSEPDFAAQLDNRAKLRQLFEALRSRLSERECEAAALCYLQGLTRAQAAQRMGISEARMTKLMEGRGPGSPGVAGKVGVLLEAISGGEWCEQQGSLMRGFAFGVLDRGGERYRLARLHQRECPSCRAYVLSLRGLAAVLPPLPLPLPLPWGLGFGGPPTPSSPTHTAASAKAGAGTGAGAITASGAAGAGGAAAGGAASGGWLLGGTVGAKLAVGCVLALSVGCVALTVAPHHAGAAHRSHARQLASASRVADPSAATAYPALAGSAALGGSISGESSARGVVPHTHILPTARAAAVRRAAVRHAQQEFGLEGSASATATASSSPQSVPATARAASIQQAGTTSATDSTSAPAAASSSTPSGPPSRAEREFGPE